LKGECITGEQAMARRNANHIYSIGNGKFIDAYQILSCYGRYYQKSSTLTGQNVSVHRLPWTDPQKSVCFITTKDVHEGQEFYIAHGCETIGFKRTSDADGRTCTRLEQARPETFEAQIQEYTTEALIAMMAEFQEPEILKTDKYTLCCKL
jgi:hypothetical protein